MGSPILATGLPHLTTDQPKLTTGSPGQETAPVIIITTGSLSLLNVV